jgi:hypothetical protein
MTGEELERVLKDAHLRERSGTGWLTDNVEGGLRAYRTADDAIKVFQAGRSEETARQIHWPSKSADDLIAAIADVNRKIAAWRKAQRALRRK